MDSQFRAFEAPFELKLVETTHIEPIPGEAAMSQAATPLCCHRSMRPQQLVPWTPTRLMGALLTALVSTPVQLLQPATNRRRA